MNRRFTKSGGRQSTRPGFFQGVMVAVILAFVATITATGLSAFIGIGAASRLVIPLLGLSYLLYLVSRSGERTGRVTVIVAWCGISLALWWIEPPLPMYILIHAGAIWLTRSLYFYSGIIPSLLDMALTGFALMTAAWALSRTGSLFMGTWSFFLIQALFAGIPADLNHGKKVAATSDEPFERARRRAEAALRQLMIH